MTDHRQTRQLAADATPQKKSRFSIIWLVPIVALAVGGWLAYKAISEKGPTITISFTSGDGLEAGKTKIKYKEVEIGRVEQVGFNRETNQIEATAQLSKGAAPYLTDKTRFWVVRAQVRGGSVSGLSTLLSGAYIGVDPSKEGNPTHHFQGLETPPVVTIGQPGRHFWLHADRLGSLDIGAPVYYRQIQVGQVVSYDFSKDGQAVDVQVFVEAPHHLRVTENTRFWIASGVDVSLNAQGLKVDTESLVSIVSGGIGFDLPHDAQPGKEAGEYASFKLYPDRASILEKTYAIRRQWMLVFDQSVRGLSVGAPVELFGTKLGEVVSFDLEYDAAEKKFRIPVIVAIEPERIRVVNANGKTAASADDALALLKWLVEERGLRAQLQSANLITGQLMVNLNFHQDAAKETFVVRDGYPVVPTIPASFERLQDNLMKITNSLEQIPFGQIGGELQGAIKEAKLTLQKIGGLADKLDQKTAPQLQETLAALEATLAELQGVVGKDSPLLFNAGKTMDELNLTLRSLRDLANSLQKQPQSLIFGKEKEKGAQ